MQEKALVSEKGPGLREAGKQRPQPLVVKVWQKGCRQG